MSRRTGPTLVAKLHMALKKRKRQGIKHRFFDVAGFFLKKQEGKEDEGGQPKFLTSPRVLTVAFRGRRDPTYDELEFGFRQFHPELDGMRCVFIKADEITEGRFYQRNAKVGALTRLVSSVSDASQNPYVGYLSRLSKRERKKNY